MGSLLAATRPTRRDIRHHPWRVVAAVVLIALPIALFTLTLTWSQSGFLTLSITQQRTTATYLGGICTQSPNAHLVDCTGAEDISGAEEKELLDSALPEGFSAHLYLSLWGVVLHGAAGTGTQIAQVPAAMFPRDLDPGTGELPGPGEIMLTDSAARAIGAEVGDTVEVRIDGRSAPFSLQVSGLAPGILALVTEPTLISPAERGTWDDGYGSGWTVVGPRPFTWSDVLTLNAVGFQVSSLDVEENPPSPDQVAPGYHSVTPGFAGGLGGSLPFLIVSVAFYLLGMVLLLLLIVPVFAVTASRQAQVFALMSSQGATPWHIRWAVLTYGAVAGVSGAALGLLAGVGGAFVGWTIRYPGWPLSIPWGDTALVALFAIVGSLLAAFLPSLIASRAAISAGVEGAAPDRLLSWRPWMAVGPLAFVLFGGGWLLAWTLSSDSPAQLGDYLSMFRTLVHLALLIALAACAPALVWLLGRLNGRLPLPVRLASRDSRRRSMRSVSAVAAIMAVVFLPVSIMVGQQASEARSHDLNSRVYQPNLVVVAPTFQSGESFSPEDLAPAVATVRAWLGDAREFEIRGISWPAGMSTMTLTLADEQRCDYDEELRDFVPPDGRDPATDPGAAADCLTHRRVDWAGGPLAAVGSQTFVAGPEILDAFIGMDETTRERAAAALEGTGVLTAVGGPEGKVEVSMVETNYNTATGEPTDTPLAAATLPVHPLLPELFPGRILSPAAAEVLGLTPTYVGTAFLAEEEFDRTGQYHLREVIEEDAYGVMVEFTRPFWFPPQLPVIYAAVAGALIIVVVTLILAISAPQSRRQFMLLDALGAHPSLAPRASAAFAGLSTAAGTITGVLAGHLTAWLVASRTMTDINGMVLQTGETGFIRVYWWAVLILVVIVPLINAAVGLLFHRRRGELEYREA